MSEVERRASPDPRYHVRRSAPVGRIMLSRLPLIHRGPRRMMPKSWPQAFWFKSALFEHGSGPRRTFFAKLLTNGPHQHGAGNGGKGHE